MLELENLQENETFETIEQLDYTEDLYFISEQLVKANNNLLILIALFSISLTFVIIKDLFNRR